MMTLLALLATGCASGAKPRAVPMTVQAPAQAAAAGERVVPVAYEGGESETVATPALAQPPLIESPAGAANQPRRLPASEASPVVGLTLEWCESLAAAHSPSVAAAEARIRALHGKWVQVGLKPNPTVGYASEEIGDDGTAGLQGGFASQRFITAHKLQRNRDVVCAEITRARQQLAIVLQQVNTDARMRYYDVLLAQRRMQLARDLANVATKSAETSQKLYDAKEIPLAGLLQTEVQLQNATVLRQTSQNQLDQAWRQLATLVGDETLTRQPLVGDVHALPKSLDYAAQLASLQSTSPELATAMANVTRARRTVHRECAQAVPNITGQVTVQFNDATNDTVTGVQVGVPLPIFDRNQGGVCQAQSQVTEAMRNVDRVELDLAQRLAAAFRQYADARATAETFAGEILPRSQQAIELVRKGYQQGEGGYLDLLAAQRTYSEANLAYLNALGQAWRSYLRIDGLLLEGSLAQPIE